MGVWDRQGQGGSVSMSWHHYRRRHRLRILLGTARRVTQSTSEPQMPATLPTGLLLLGADATKSVTVEVVEEPSAEAPSREVTLLSLLRPRSESGVNAGQPARHLGSQDRTETRASVSTNDRRWKRQFSPLQRAEKAGHNPWT